MSKTVSLLIALTSAVSACDTFPNSTDTKLNWYTCPFSNTPINSLKITKNNQEVYPVKLSEKLYVHLNVDNSEDHTEIRLDIEVHSWGGWTGCSWHKVPTFGLLSNLNACEHGVPCPIKVGKQDLTIEIDFSKYARIIKALKDDAPYQIVYKLTDRNTAKVTCSVVQARARTKVGA